MGSTQLFLKIYPTLIRKASTMYVQLGVTPIEEVSTHGSK